MDLKKVRNAKSAKTRVKAMFNHKKSQGSIGEPVIGEAATPGGLKNLTMSPKFEHTDDNQVFSQKMKL